jgi:16S rRNA (uracil1498-N3)-methyltransferase
MNLLLLYPEELDCQLQVRLTGRRAEHLLSVLRVQPGQALRAGRLDHDKGVAQVLQVDAASVAVSVRYQPQQVHRAQDSVSLAAQGRCLLLAIPRPKVLSRCLEHAAALGYTTIVLLRTARVEKSHLQSHKLLPSDIRPHLIAGLEQGCCITLPRVQVFDRFKPFVEDLLDSTISSTPRFVAHPAAVTALPATRLAAREYCLAIGPEGGFLPYEVEQLEARGFVAIRAEVGPLRVESALSYLTGQLDLLASLGFRN